MRPRRRLITRIARAFAVTLGVLLALVAGALAFLHSASGQEFLRKKVEARLNERVNGKVAIARLGLHLFGNVELGGVVVSDATGKPVVELDALTVVPAWRELSSSRVVIQRVELTGLRLAIEQDADGVSNLKRLLKPSAPSAPSPPSRTRRQIVVREIALQKLGLTLTKADGSTLAVRELGVDATLDAVPSEKTVTLRVSRLALSLTRAAPKGPKLELSDFQTSLDVALIEGHGKLSLGALRASLGVERPDAPRYSTPVNLGGIEVELREGGLGATLTKLEAGLALLDTLELEGGTNADGLSGPQRALVAGLHLDAKQLNTLLGKPLILTDVQLRVKVDGQPENLSLDTLLASAGGKLTLNGKLDASKLDRPGYDLTLTGTSIASRKLLSNKDAPDVEVEKLSLGVKGTGAKKDEIEADVRLDVGPIRIGRIHIDDVMLRGRLDKGVVTIRELTLHALDQTLKASGSFVLADKRLELKVELSGDVGQALAAARRAGVPIKSNVPPGAISLGKGEFQLEVKGKLDEGLTVSLPSARLRVAGGSVKLDGNVTLSRSEPDASGKRALGLDKLDTDVVLSGVRLTSLAALRGKKLQGIDGTVSGAIHLRGTKQDPSADLDLLVRAKRTDDARAPELALNVKAKGGKRNLDAIITLERRGAGGADTLVTVNARLPITVKGRRGLDAGRPLAVELDMPRVTLGELLLLLPPAVADKLAKVPRQTSLEAHAKLGGSSSAPSGEVSLDVVAWVPFAPIRPRIAVRGRLSPDGKGSHATATVRALLDENKAPLVSLDADARFGGSPLLPRGTQEVEWKLAGKVSPQNLGSLPLPPERFGDLSGKAGLDFELAGNRKDATGHVELALSKIQKGELGPIDAKLTLALEPEATRVDLGVKAAGLDALRTRGTLGVGGRGLFAKIKEKRLGGSALNVDVVLPRHHLKEWAALRPKLERFLGAAGGAIHVDGTLDAPTAKGELALDDFLTASGEPGRASVNLDANLESVGVDVSLGPLSDRQALALRVHTARAALAEFLKKKTGEAALEVQLTARAKDKPLGNLLPKLTRDFPDTGAKGTFNWHMDGKFSLASTDGARRLADATLDGQLSLTDGSVPIPKSKRRYEHVELAISAAHDALGIEKLELHEADREKPDRRISITGRVPWRKLRPDRLDLEIQAKDFLLFGTDTLGMPDAPRAALTAKISVAGDLSQPRRRVDATVHNLDLVMPDRLDKAHWPEKADLGDVLTLGEPGVKLGKLPTPKPLSEPPPPPPSNPPPADAPGAAGTDLFVHIIKPIKVQKMPFELVAKGELEVAIRAGKKPAVRGELKVVDGYMSLGGRLHGIDHRHKSRIYFDAAHPGGELDLFVHLAPNPVVLQDVSLASSGGNDVRLHLTGPIAKAVSNVNGVGNADLWDMLPVYNAGRVKFWSQPDMQATATVQLPREYDVVLLSYMAANLPHNLFLSRMNAWADPHDGRAAYGRVQHMEADRYSESGKSRIRATARPPTLGQSSAELEAAHLFVNEPHTKVGAGVVAGSRLGGGPAVFFDWASQD